MKIINIKPKTRKKGFDKSNFTFSDVKNKIDDELINKLNILKRKIVNYNLNSNEKKTGCTVHFVNEKLDSGNMIIKKSFFILPEDNEKSLKIRTQLLEYKAYPEAIIKIFRNN